MRFVCSSLHMLHTLNPLKTQKKGDASDSKQTTEQDGCQAPYSNFHQIISYCQRVSINFVNSGVL